MRAMIPDIKLSIFILIVLIATAAFFSCAEAALLSFDWLRLRFLVRKGNRRAAMLEGILSRKDRLIGTIIVGNNIANIAASAIATWAAIMLWGENGVAYATGAMTFVILIAGEIAPKNFALRRVEAVGLAVAPVFRVLVVLFHPLVLVVNSASNLILRLLGTSPSPAGHPGLSEEELRALISDSTSTAAMGENKRQMLRGVFLMGRKTAREIMVPRNRIRALDIALDMETAMEEFLKSGYTRMPVYGEDLDRIVGIVHSRDVLELVAGKREGGLNAVVRPTFFVPETINLEKLLFEFQARRTHLAMVVDEYGGVNGLVTLEDVLEEIVGEIRDEHDLEGEHMRFLPGGEVLVQGHSSLRDVNHWLDLRLPRDVDVSLGGFVMTMLGHIPETGESFVYGDMRFTVERAGGRRVHLVRITPVGKKA